MASRKTAPRSTPPKRARTPAAAAPAARRGRGRTALPESERKARLIQTRVDDGLDATLRDEARRRRVTVSQLIRHVLEDTFDLVDNIVATSASLAATVRRDARRIADSAQGRRPGAPPARAAAAAARVARPEPEVRLDEVDAWQQVRLNRAASCAGCGTPLGRGQAALLGLGPAAEPGQARLYLCPDCGERLAS